MTLSFYDPATLITMGSGSAGKTIPVHLVHSDSLATLSAGLNAFQSGWMATQGFKADAGSVLVMPAADGSVESVWFGVNPADSANATWLLGDLPQKLPAGTYHLANIPDGFNAELLALGWMLGGYRFDALKSRPSSKILPQLVAPVADMTRSVALAKGICLARDLINLPTSHLNTAELAEAAEKLAAQHQASFSQIVGDDLVTQNWPAVHAVGRASSSAPRVLDVKWQSSHKGMDDKDLPLVTLVGKGVCFDTGGYNIKPGSAMALMKKDMGGAAIALGLAHFIMAMNLPVRLRVLVGAVENSIAGNAMRPSDVIATRKGKTVEVGDTDAEGRLVLADLLHEAGQDNPDLLLDFATLTGAARSALGPDLPALFSNRDDVAMAYAKAGMEVGDPVWHMPLWAGYLKDMDSAVADINSIAGNSFAGAIYAALFLQQFVPESVAWAHLDTYGWNPKARPGKTPGGAALGLIAAAQMIQKRFQP